MNEPRPASDIAGMHELRAEGKTLRQIGRQFGVSKQRVGQLLRRARDPQTPQEWQEAVDLAYFGLSIDSCRQYGLIEGGPQFDVERCAEMIERGEKRDVRPNADAFERILAAFLSPKA